MDDEQLGQILHEAGKEAVEKGKTVGRAHDLHKPFPWIEWADLHEDAKEGRRIQARYLLEKFPLLDGDLERLADLEHEQWMSWSKYVTANNGLPVDLIEKWAKNWVPYSELSEEMKEHDRVWARKVLEVSQ